MVEAARARAAGGLQRPQALAQASGSVPSACVICLTPGLHFSCRRPGLVPLPTPRLPLLVLLLPALLLQVLPPPLLLRALLLRAPPQHLYHRQVAQERSPVPWPLPCCQPPSHRLQLHQLKQQLLLLLLLLLLRHLGPQPHSGLLLRHRLLPPLLPSALLWRLTPRAWPWRCPPLPWTCSLPSAGMAWDQQKPLQRPPLLLTNTLPGMAHPVPQARQPQPPALCLHG